MAQSNTKEFIQKAIQKHGSKFCYDQVHYVGATTKITIKCNTCLNVFTQQPNNHLTGQGCPKCKGTCKSKEDREKEVEGLPYVFDFSTYVNNKSLIKVYCPKHNKTDFRPVYQINVRGKYCSLCTKEKLDEKRITTKTENFLKISSEIHKNQYDYSSSVYKGATTPICIKCNVCNSVFFQRPHNHMRGHGCPDCGGNSQGWGPERYAGKPAIFYILQLHNSMFKIGITSRTVDIRYAREKTDYNILYQVSFLNGEDAWTIEKYILTQLSIYRYKGENILTTAGTREILTVDPLPVLFNYLNGNTND